MARAFRSFRFARLLTVAGVALLVLGALPWAAALGDVEGAREPLLLTLAALAVIGGAFVALVGIGIGRAVRDAQRAADERRLDAVVLAAAAAQAEPDCGDNCPTCTASCALQELRR